MSGVAELCVSFKNERVCECGTSLPSCHLEQRVCFKDKNTAVNPQAGVGSSINHMHI